MTQEEKIKDLEERIAIMDATDSALCADLEHWKRVASGAKGRNKQLAEENKAMKDKILGYTKEIERLNDAVKTVHDLAANYKSELYKTKVELTDYKAFIEWYNELPWWKKVFVKRMEIY